MQKVRKCSQRFDWWKILMMATQWNKYWWYRDYKTIYSAINEWLINWVVLQTLWIWCKANSWFNANIMLSNLWKASAERGWKRWERGHTALLTVSTNNNVPAVTTTCWIFNPKNDIFMWHVQKMYPYSLVVNLSNTMLRILALQNRVRRIDANIW